MTELWLVLLSMSLIAICGAFVAVEFALLTVNRTMVEKKAQSGDKVASGILLALKSLSTQLSGVQLGITITNLLVGFLAEPAIARLIAPQLTLLGCNEITARGIAVVIGITLATMVTMIYGELVPKYIAILKPMEVARRLQAPMRVFTYLALPLIKVLNGAANFILRSRGVKPQEELAVARSADELLSLVRRSADKGTLAQSTAQMLERSLTFRELTAVDVMTPRVHMHMLSEDASINDLLKLSSKTGHSRFPVYAKSHDDVVGIVRIKYALRVPIAKRSSATVKEIMAEANFVPSTIELSSLIEVLREENRHIVIVVDEFGGVDGVVTIEDLLEELVGEVYDEFDQHRRKQYQQLTANSWVVSGLLRPDEISHEIGVVVADEEEVDTIAGLYMLQEKEVPEVGDSTTLDGVNKNGDAIYVRMTVMKMDGQRIDQLKLAIRKRPVTEEA